MTGSIAGGWPFVLAAYGITLTFLGLYTIGAVLRYRNGLRRAAAEPRRRPEAS